MLLFISFALFTVKTIVVKICLQLRTVVRRDIVFGKVVGAVGVVGCEVLSDVSRARRRPFLIGHKTNKLPQLTLFILAATLALRCAIPALIFRTFFS